MTLYVMYRHAGMDDPKVFILDGSKKNAVEFLKKNGERHAELFEGTPGYSATMIASIVDGEFQEFKAGR